MPISWSALEVSEAMDKVESLLNDAQPILSQAHRVVVEAKEIPNLPQYMEQRLSGLRETLASSISRPRDGVDSVRKALPEGAVERERKQPKMMLEV